MQVRGRLTNLRGRLLFCRDREMVNPDVAGEVKGVVNGSLCNITVQGSRGSFVREVKVERGS